MSKKLLKVPSKAQRRVFAKETLLQARKCLGEKCVLEAEFLYMEGMQMLRELISEETLIPKREQYLQEQRTHEQRFCALQAQLQRHMESCKIVARYTLRDGARGHSYQTLFEPYMSNEVHEIHIYEPYLTDRQHYKNLVNFIEVCLKHCRKLAYMRVFTRPDSRNCKYQLNVFKTLRYNLSKASITFSFRFRQGMTERKILLGNGVIIKTQRGLHIYLPAANAYDLGLCDFDFRECHQTEVDIWHTSKPFYESICESVDHDHGDAVTIY